MSASSTFRDVTVAVALMLASTPAGALNASRSVAQYLRDDWGASKGYRGGPVYGFAQTPDGYLWIASDDGVIRFDGVRFEALPVQESATPGGPTALNVMTADDGELWLRMRGRSLLAYRDGAFQDVMTAHGQRPGTIGAMSAGRGGGILIAGYNGVLRFRRGAFVMVIPPQLMPDAPVIAVAETNEAVWLGTRDAGLFRFDGKTVVHVDGLLPDEKVNCVMADDDGAIWIGTDRGLARWTAKRVVRVALASDTENVAVFSLVRDGESNLWVAAGSRGVIRIDRDGSSALPNWDARIDGVATALFEDRERDLWIGTTRGIVRLRDGIFATYPASSGHRADPVGAVHVDVTGRVWFAPTAGGLYGLDAGRARVLRLAGLDADVVYSIASHADELWIGRQYGGLTHLRFIHGAPVATEYTESSGLAQNSVFVVHTTASGTVWAGTVNGGVSRLAGGTFQTFTTKDGLAANAVTSIAESPDGTMWFGSPEGLTRLSHNQWQRYTASDNLPSGDITALLADRDGTVWVGTTSGLARFRQGPNPLIEPLATVREPIVGLTRDQAGALWCATSTRLVRVSPHDDIRQFDEADGVVSRQGVRRSGVLVTDPRGRIWYAAAGGLSMADPASFSGTSVQVPLRINTVSADETVSRASSAITLPSGHRRIGFSYTAVSLAIPERVRYRYRLDAFDRAWSTPSTERTATYTNLSPGHYVFRVIASDSSGQWNGAAQAVALDVQPAVWQTASFRLAALLAGLVSIWAVYRVRLAQMSRHLNVRFEERLAERNRIAQELHDTLLQGFLSASMQLHVAASRVPDDLPARSQLVNVQHLMGRVIDDGRNAIRGLRTPVSNVEDLELALAGVARQLGIGEATRFRVIVDGQAQSVHPIVRDEVYRIAREALANAIRHAHAQTIELELDYHLDQLLLIVRDDGVGIDDEIARAGRDGHWGMSGMRERAESVGARLRIRSRVGAGTEVELSIPGTIAFQRSGSTRRRWWERWRGV